jgi:hypothetical protein
MGSVLLNSAVLTIIVSAGLLEAAEIAQTRPALDKAVIAVQRSTDVWFTKQQCTSCHHSVLPTFALTEAREHGIAIRENSAKKHFTRAFAYLTDLDALAQGYNSTDAELSDRIVAAHAAGLPRNTATAALVRMIASRQLPDGHWRTLDFRPPQSGSPFTRTAAENRSSVQRAREWLQSNKAINTEDRAFQMIGLAWTDSDREVLKRLSRELLADQREDGGWAQIPRRPTDAYSTGEALVVLHSAGAITVVDPAYQRGVAFLLKTQKPDGSWHVVSRIHDDASISPPYFESGIS